MYGIKELLRDEKGAVAVECAVLALFLFVAPFVLADAAALRPAQAETDGVAGDAARQMSTGGPETADGAGTFGPFTTPITKESPAALSRPLGTNG